MIAHAAGVRFEDADGGAFGFAGAAEDGVAAGGLDGGDDGGGGGVAGYGDEVFFEGGRHMIDTCKTLSGLERLVDASVSGVKRTV